MITLGIETSCDDTSVSVLEGDNTIRSNLVSSQDLIHKPFGGIVPELASRSHMTCITSVVDQALLLAGITMADIDLLAVTQGPGLIGSLLVGFSYGKALSYTLGKPYVGVDHMSGHILSVFLEKDIPQFPYIALIVSGGTTALYQANDFEDYTMLGRTRDDAAGEAFDKVARLLNLGYPGGPVISQQAKMGKNDTINFPRAWLQENSLDFSFSGLKTSVMNHCNKVRMKKETLDIPDICASFQEAVVEVLVEKTILACKIRGISRIVLGGGVAANYRLRERLQIRCVEEDTHLYLPALVNCTDNGAMIALSGRKRFQRGITGKPNDDVFSRSPLGQ